VTAADQPDESLAGEALATRQARHNGFSRGRLWREASRGDCRLQRPPRAPLHSAVLFGSTRSKGTATTGVVRPMCNTRPRGFQVTSVCWCKVQRLRMCLRHGLSPRGCAERGEGRMEIPCAAPGRYPRLRGR
jgi:hypothetical protein